MPALFLMLQLSSGGLAGYEMSRRLILQCFAIAINPIISLETVISS